MLNVDITLAQGSFRLAAAFTAGDGLTALFGPSGSGKSTVIQAIAGLTRPDAGVIRFGERVFFDSDAGICLPAHRRRIGTVFQEARLFPHLTVRQNLTYGRWFRRGSGPALAAITGLLGLDGLTERMPARLSGGERQRVALGRALMSAPDLLLMDEPLSALDDTLKQEILPYLEAIRDQGRVPILYVSHARSEITRLANRIVLIEAGRTRPADSLPPAHDGSAMPEPGTWIHVEAAAADPETGLMQARSPAGTIHIKGTGFAAGQRLRLFLPAQDVILARGEPGELSALNRLPGTISALTPRDRDLLVTVDCGGEPFLALVTRQSAEALRLADGAAVTLLFKTVTLSPEAVYREAPPA